MAVGGVLVRENQSAATRKFQCTVHACGKRLEVECTTGGSDNGKRISVHVQYDNKKAIQLIRSANTRMLNLHIKHSIKCETVADIQDRHVAKLRSK
jgi:hypothetical protein